MPMVEYFVRWEISINAKTPEAAARHCVELMRDSPARYFTVTDKATGKISFVDLLEAETA